MLKMRNTFQRMVMMIVILLVPTIGIYTYSNRHGSDIIEQELIQLTLNQQMFLVEQLELINEQLWKSAYITMSDPNALMLQSQSITEPGFDQFRIIDTLDHHLRLQSTSYVFEYELTLFSPDTGAYITTAQDRKFDMFYFESHFYTDWSYETLNIDGQERRYFIRHMTKPFTLDSRPKDRGLILEVAIPESNFIELMEQFSKGRTGEPLMYHQTDGVIIRQSAPTGLKEQFMTAVAGRKLGESGYEVLEFAKERYLLNYTETTWQGWYLVDLVPLKEVVAPLNLGLRWFYFVMVLLLLVGIVMAVMIYRSVQMPIFELIRGVRRLKQGQYGFVIPLRGESEFNYLFTEFNRMSEETRRLIEQVYIAQLRVRDATLKELQSQINPHFLYNNFAFIQSMARMGNKEAVIAFTQHLSQYYRYTIKSPSDSTALYEELHLIRSYLEIHKMQTARMEYVIEVPESVLELKIPRLIIQPVVENAIIHGIEKVLKDGLIRVTGEEELDYVVITVENTGGGLELQEIEELQERVNLAEAHGSLGLWNIQQRLVLHNRENKGIVFSASPLGGLKVELFLRKHADGGNQDG